MKKVILYVVSVSLMLGTVFVSSKAQIDFSSDEAYYRAVCSSSSNRGYDAGMCNDFYQYLTNRRDEFDRNINSLRSSVEALGADISNAENVLIGINNDLAALEESVKAVQKEIDRLELEIVAKEDLIKERMFAMQAFIGTNVYIDLIMEATNLTEFITRVQYVNDITNADSRLIEELALLQGEQLAQKDSLETKKADVIELKTLQEVAISKIRDQRATMLAQMEAANSQRQDVSDALGRVDFGSVPPSSAGLILPVASGSYNCNYGSNSMCYWGPYGGAHFGIDIGPIPRGSNPPLVAPANGVVLFSTNDPNFSWGKMVYMAVSANGQTYTVAYGHMDHVAVSAGQVVTQGQYLGNMGTTGFSTGVHLHLELYQHSNSLEQVVNGFRGYFNYGTRVNPANFFNVGPLGNTW